MKYHIHTLKNGLRIVLAPMKGTETATAIVMSGTGSRFETARENGLAHFLEHLTWPERVHFFNELCRVLKKGGKAQISMPHWASSRYYGDPTHKEPFSEMGFYYLSKDWRKTDAPHACAEHNPNGYACDFEATWGYSLRADLMTRNVEYQQYALSNFKEAAQDIIATLTAKK